MPVCQYCKEVSFVQRSRLYEHEKDCPDRPKFKCSKCDKSFVQQSNLDQHESVCPDKPKFKCSKCDKSFIYDKDLKKHFKKVHETTRKMLKCSECDKECLDPRTLKNHIKIVHKGENPFGCGVCKKVLGSKVALKGHLQYFCKGEKPFELKCPICDSKFNDQLEKTLHDHVFHKENSIVTIEKRRNSNTIRDLGLVLDSTFSLVAPHERHSIQPVRQRIIHQNPNPIHQNSNPIHQNSNPIHQNSNPWARYCDSCRILFHSQGALKTHILLNHWGVSVIIDEHDRYMCLFCKRRFLSISGAESCARNHD